MEKNILITGLACLINAGISFGQDLAPSQVPSVVINKFHQSFPKASGAEWELKGDLYKVEFETGWLSTDHDVSYDKTGKLIEHKEEIARKALPQPILTKIKTDFPRYRTDDIKKITKGKQIVYMLELKSSVDEWKLIFDPNGQVLSKAVD